MHGAQAVSSGDRKAGRHGQQRREARDVQRERLPRQPRQRRGTEPLRNRELEVEEAEGDVEDVLEDDAYDVAYATRCPHPVVELGEQECSERRSSVEIGVHARGP